MHHAAGTTHHLVFYVRAAVVAVCAICVVCTDLTRFDLRHQQYT